MNSLGWGNSPYFGSSDSNRAMQARNIYGGAGRTPLPPPPVPVPLPPVRPSSSTAVHLPTPSGDVFMEAGRLAAEYLVSQGLLPASILPNTPNIKRWSSGRDNNGGLAYRDFTRLPERENPQQRSGRTSALARLGNSVVPDGPVAREEDFSMRTFSNDGVFYGKRKFPDDHRRTGSRGKGRKRSGLFKGPGSSNWGGGDIGRFSVQYTDRQRSVSAERPSQWLPPLEMEQNAEDFANATKQPYSGDVGPEEEEGEEEILDGGDEVLHASKNDSEAELDNCNFSEVAGTKGTQSVPVENAASFINNVDENDGSCNRMENSDMGQCGSADPAVVEGEKDDLVGADAAIEDDCKLQNSNLRNEDESDRASIEEIKVEVCVVSESAVGESSSTEVSKQEDARMETSLSSDLKLLPFGKVPTRARSSHRKGHHSQPDRNLVHPNEVEARDSRGDAVPQIHTNAGGALNSKNDQDDVHCIEDDVTRLNNLVRAEAGEVSPAAMSAEEFHELGVVCAPEAEPFTGASIKAPLLQQEQPANCVLESVQLGDWTRPLENMEASSLVYGRSKSMTSFSHTEQLEDGEPSSSVYQRSRSMVSISKTGDPTSLYVSSKPVIPLRENDVFFVEGGSSSAVQDLSSETLLQSMPTMARKSLSPHDIELQDLKPNDIKMSSGGVLVNEMDQQNNVASMSGTGVDLNSAAGPLLLEDEAGNREVKQFQPCSFKLFDETIAEPVQSSKTPDDNFQSHSSPHYSAFQTEMQASIEIGLLVKDICSSAQQPMSMETDFFGEPPMSTAMTGCHENFDINTIEAGVFHQHLLPVLNKYPVLRSYYQSKDSPVMLNCLVCMALRTPMVFSSLDELLNHTMNVSDLPQIHKGYFFATTQFLDGGFQNNTSQDQAVCYLNGQPYLGFEEVLPGYDDPIYMSLDEIAVDMPEI